MLKARPSPFGVSVGTWAMLRSRSVLPLGVLSVGGRGRTLSACDHRRTRNRHGPGESDCLIKTKHRESPVAGFYAM